MKHDVKCSFEALSIENLVVQQISRDGEFHFRSSRPKRKLTLLFTLLFAGVCANAQPALVSGFTGMAAVNATTYTKTGVVGDPTGGYSFVCASGDGTSFFSSSFFKHYLYFINPSTYAVTDSMAHDFYHISAQNEPNTLFARTDSGLCRINTVTKTITDSVNIPNAFAVAERPNSKEVWVGAKNRIFVVNYAAGMAATPFTYSSLSNAEGDIRFTPGGTMAYKLAWSGSKLYKIDAASKTVLDSVTCSSSPSNLEVSRDSSKVFVTFPNDKKIRIYATATMSLIDSIDCGTREPFDIYRHPTRAEIWVVNHFKDTITVFNEGTYAQIAAFPVTSSPHSLAFGTGGTAAGSAQMARPVVTAYPNPVTNTVTLKGIATGDKISVYDMAGRELFALQATGSLQTFNIASLAPGTYMINISGARADHKARLPITKL